MLVPIANSVETRDELNAFDPWYIDEQAKYTLLAIKHILQIYKSKNISSIAVVAHSMGGIVARRLVALDGYSDQVSAIYTLATPHFEPPLTLKSSMLTFYKDLNLYWKINHGVEGKLRNITLVSIAGGTRDLVIDSWLTNPKDTMHGNQSLSVFSTGIPGAWTSSDHEGMIWCDQILTTLSQSIFRSIGKDAMQRMSIYRNLFLGDVLNDKVTHSDQNTYKISRESLLVYFADNTFQIPKLSTGSDKRLHWFHILHEYMPLELHFLTNVGRDRVRIHGCFDSYRDVPAMNCQDLERFRC